MDAFFYSFELIYWIITGGIYYFAFKKIEKFTWFGVLLAYLTSVLFFKLADYSVELLMLDSNLWYLLLSWAFPFVLNIILLGVYNYFLNKPGIKDSLIFNVKSQVTAVALSIFIGACIFVLGAGSAFTYVDDQAHGQLEITLTSPFSKKVYHQKAKGMITAEEKRAAGRSVTRFAFPLLVIGLFGALSSDFKKNK